MYISHVLLGSRRIFAAGDEQFEHRVELRLEGLPTLRQGFRIVSPTRLFRFGVGVLLVATLNLFTIARGDFRGF